MKRTVLTFGLLSGLVVSAMMVLTMPFIDQIGMERGMVVGYASMLAAFLLVYFGIRTYRDNVAGGTVSFGRAFTVGALIALIASVCYTVTWEVYYFGFDSDFTAKYTALTLESARAKGASPAELEQKAAEMKKFAEMYENPVINVAYTLIEPLPLGLVVALVSAGMLSRRRRDATTTSTVAQTV